VPAAAVTQGGQVLFYMTGRKGYVGGFFTKIIKRNAMKNLIDNFNALKNLSL